MKYLLYLAIIFLSAMLVANILGKFRLPEVTGYLICGVILGPSLLGIIPKDYLKDFEILSTVALSFIAFNIGSEMDLNSLKALGTKIIIITFFEAFMAFVSVFTVMIISGQSMVFALVLGAISSATAPAATLMVIKQYRAKGPLVDTLMPVVALDDAFCIMIFGIASTLATNLLAGSSLDIFHMVLLPILEIIAALVLGLVLGVLSSIITKRLKNQLEVTMYVIALIFIQTFISDKFNLSSLLMIMAFGVTLSNTTTKKSSIINALQGIQGPLYLLFFTLSGADLDFSVFKNVGFVAILYVFSRAFGKFIGAKIGCDITKANPKVSKYLGFTLFPQAGVAIGLSLIAQNIIPGSQGSEIRAIVLAGVVIYELLGPLITKTALIKAGEIQTEKL